LALSNTSQGQNRGVLHQNRGFEVFHNAILALSNTSKGQNRGFLHQNRGFLHQKSRTQPDESRVNARLIFSDKSINCKKAIRFTKKIHTFESEITFMMLIKKLHN
jgi:hypothetical protein